MQRFQAEIRAVAKLDHPNIVRALDAQTAGGLHLFVMEYVDGQRLDEVVAARGRLAVDYACKCARLAALGLQHAHERGLAHRDFKPQNLMLSKTGQVKILDFGLSKLAASSASRGGMTSQGVILGTPEYMAPEQARDTSTAGPLADVYALGATLFYLLTGQPPFTGTTAIDIVVKQLNDVPPRVTDLRPDVPAGLADLIARMLAKDTADRPQTAKDVAEALGPYTTRAAASPGASVAESPPLTSAALPSLTTSLRRTATRRRWPLVAAVLLAIGLAVTAAVVFRVKTADGNIVVTVNEPDAEVFVDGERITVTRKGDEPIEIRKAAGKHTLEVKKGGFKLESRELMLKAEGREPIKINLEALFAVKPQEPRKEEPVKSGEITLPAKQKMPEKPAEEKANLEKPVERPPVSANATTEPAADPKRSPAAVDPWGLYEGWEVGTMRKMAIWVDEGGWHLRVTNHRNAKNIKHSYTGTVAVVGGLITEVRPRLPKGYAHGRIEVQPDKSRLTIDFQTTSNGRQAGFDFQVSKGSRQLDIEITRPDHGIFIGRKGWSAPTGTFSIPVVEPPGGSK